MLKREISRFGAICAKNHRKRFIERRVASISFRTWKLFPNVLYYFFVYEDISNMASTRCVGVFGVCGVVCSIGSEVFVDLEKDGGSLYRSFF